jgi:hypothetical protein
MIFYRRTISLAALALLFDRQGIEETRINFEPTKRARSANYQAPGRARHKKGKR